MYSLVSSCFYPHIRSFIQSFIHPINHYFLYPQIHPFTISCVHSFVFHPHINPSIPPFLHLFIHLSICLPTYLSVHIFMHPPYIPTFIHASIPILFIHPSIDIFYQSIHLFLLSLRLFNPSSYPFVFRSLIQTTYPSVNIFRQKPQPPDNPPAHSAIYLPINSSRHPSNCLSIRLVNHLPLMSLLVLPLTIKPPINPPIYPSLQIPSMNSY